MILRRGKRRGDDRVSLCVFSLAPSSAKATLFKNLFLIYSFLFERNFFAFKYVLKNVLDIF